MDDYSNRMKEYISNLIKSEITALDEKAKRDYKAEYKKFQSSTKAKKYRAELNKYNRKKGTYGNGDGKDASHKGGKIVGFEAQSKNRGRAEKSRLKKEDIGDKFVKQRMTMLRRFFDQNYGRVKKAVERDARTGSNEFRNTDNRGEKFKLTIVINRLKELRNKLQKKDRGLADFFTKNIKVIEKTKDKMRESVNEVNMAHVYSKDLNKKKFKDLGLYLAHVLDLSPRYDFKLTSNKKLLAINIDKINPKSLQNIKKRFGIDLKQKAKEPIRLKSKSGMGKISHLGMESVNEVLKYPNDESKMLVAFLNTSVDGNKLKQVINKKIKNHRDFEKVIQKYHKSKGILKRYWKFDDDNDEGIDWVDYKFVYNQMKKHNYLESVNEKRGTCWVGYKQVGMKDKGGKKVPNCVKEITEVYYEKNGKGYGYTFEYINDGKLTEAEYQGRKVKLGKPMQGDTKKFKVYVKNDKGNVVKVNFGQGGDAKGGTMRIRKSNPKARKSFRARHNCDNPGPRHKARYWSCKKW